MSNHGRPWTPPTRESFSSQHPSNQGATHQSHGGLSSSVQSPFIPGNQDTTYVSPYSPRPLQQSQPQQFQDPSSQGGAYGEPHATSGQQNPSANYVLSFEEELAMRTADANKAWERGDIYTLREYCLNAVLRCRELGIEYDKLVRANISLGEKYKESNAKIAELERENTLLRSMSGTAASTQHSRGHHDTGPPGPSAYTDPNLTFYGKPPKDYWNPNQVS
ncbi:hypothetical protein L204_104838 [Cryptococcus depauperatus]|nr:hypothetical protein L204_05348 [Cryptococcus depauperatus CBS 7855]